MSKRPARGSEPAAAPEATPAARQERGPSKRARRRRPLKREAGDTLTRPCDVLIVGIGASAGGLEALQQFFDHMPGDSGMAFVVVTHLPAGRVSLMPELLARHSPMPVAEIGGPDPGRAESRLSRARRHRHRRRTAGSCCPRSPRQPPARQLVIDSFFRSLAREARERAIGIVLSGTGSDGTLGVKEIKAQSGMTMAQDEGSARYSSMPHSAIASLHVDYVLSPDGDAEAAPRAMPSTLARRVRPPRQRRPTTPICSARIFLLLRSRTGHDFSYYKSTTIRRRVERRMNVHQMESLRDYLYFLQNNAAELDRLFKELLIGVTSFFRDPEAHEALAALLPESVRRTSPTGYVFRVWVPGCSTGEEAYSLAIGFKEAMERAQSAFRRADLRDRPRPRGDRDRAHGRIPGEHLRRRERRSGWSGSSRRPRVTIGSRKRFARCWCSRRRT